MKEKEEQDMKVRRFADQMIIRVILDNDFEKLAEILSNNSELPELVDFREEQSDYFDSEGKSYKHSFQNSDMPDRMLKIINALTSHKTEI